MNWGLRHKCGFTDEKSLLTVARGSHNVQEIIDELDNSLHYVWQREGRYLKEGRGGRRGKRSRGWGADWQDISQKTEIKEKTFVTKGRMMLTPSTFKLKYLSHCYLNLTQHFNSTIPSHAPNSTSFFGTSYCNWIGRFFLLYCIIRRQDLTEIYLKLLWSYLYLTVFF